MEDRQPSEIQPLPAEQTDRSETPRTIMLDAAGVAVILKCSAKTVYRLTDSGRIPAPCRLGGLVRWNPSVIEAWIAAGCPTCRKRNGEKN